MRLFRPTARVSNSHLHTPYNQFSDQKKIDHYARGYKQFYDPRPSRLSKAAERLRYSFRSLPRRIKQLSAPKASNQDYLPVIRKKNGQLYFQLKGENSWHLLE